MKFRLLVLSIIAVIMCACSKDSLDEPGNGMSNRKSDWTVIFEEKYSGIQDVGFYKTWRDDNKEYLIEDLPNANNKGGVRKWQISYQGIAESEVISYIDEFVMHDSSRSHSALLYEKSKDYSVSFKWHSGRIQNEIMDEWYILFDGPEDENYAPLIELLNEQFIGLSTYIPSNSRYGVFSILNEFNSELIDNYILPFIHLTDYDNDRIFTVTVVQYGYPFERTYEMIK
ncbi:MAG: hypothetical protein K2K68_01040 [Duncaniella sp.]|nr:hypothetical protein [Duncaniella sp.]